MRGQLVYDLLRSRVDVICAAYWAGHEGEADRSPEQEDVQLERYFGGSSRPGHGKVLAWSLSSDPLDRPCRWPRYIGMVNFLIESLGLPFRGGGADVEVPEVTWRIQTHDVPQI